jgi:hypothetical protein
MQGIHTNFEQINLNNMDLSKREKYLRIRDENFLKLSLDFLGHEGGLSTCRIVVPQNESVTETTSWQNNVP